MNSQTFLGYLAAISEGITDLGGGTLFLGGGANVFLTGICYDFL